MSAAAGNIIATIMTTQSAKKYAACRPVVIAISVVWLCEKRNAHAANASSISKISVRMS